jgi:fatty-acyl-CoA synthase
MNALPPRARGAAPSRAWLRALETTARATRDPERVLPRAVSEWAQRYGNRPALLSERETFDFRALAWRMNQYSRWALRAGVVKGETIALMMGNRPEYFAIWLGLTQIGAVVALVNVNLRGQALAHCLKVASARRAIVAEEFADDCEMALAGVSPALEIWRHGEASGGVDGLVEAFDGEALGEGEGPAVTLSDRALLIYTSGTTGLPKAAAISHHRVVAWSHWFAGLADMTSADRMYDCLPLYHSVGGVAAIGAALVNGGSVVIAERFSASGFWSDIVRWECTMFQYIGELCRYLVAAPPCPAETAHKLRLACGNGLSQDVWRAFLDRFGAPQILEFYAATEGNVTLYNVEGRIGAIGRPPAFLAARDGLALARFDYDRQAPWRGPDGFCVRCADGEAGEALGRIGADPSQRFEGYTQGQETEKKILRDVFAPGDAWMRTGDLMRRDADGYFYFVDRIGDTFRWKGENVATNEVAAAIAAARGVREAVVYGVAVPGAEGKAGMALIAADGPPDLDDIARRLEALPRYARPLFLRLRAALDVTPTFKPKRGAMAGEGFDPSRSADPLFVFDAERGAYVPLDGARFAAIESGAMRL